MKLTKSDRSIVGRIVDREEVHRPILHTVSLGHWFGFAATPIARRVQADEPSELALGLLFLVRHKWAGYALLREKNRNPDSLWEVLLLAAAIHDWDLFNKMLLLLPDRALGPFGAQDTEWLLYEMLLSILRDTYPLPSHAEASGFRKNRLPYFSAIIASLVVMGDRNAGGFSSALEGLLAKTRSSRGLDAEDRLLCIHAHGLWEVAKRVDPKLVANWDISRGLPWDAEFHEFTRSLTSPMDLVAVPDRTEGIMKLLELKELRPVV